VTLRLLGFGLEVRELDHETFEENVLGDDGLGRMFGLSEEEETRNQVSSVHLASSWSGCER